MAYFDERAEADRAATGLRWIDPYGAYNWDGDDHWTPAAVREWWRDRARLREWIDKRLEARLDPGRPEALRAFREHLDDELEATLRGYVFWLAERRDPQPGETLPDL